jgi:hypothetical protein
MHFDYINNIILGIKENNKAELATFNDVGTYESLI